MVTEGNLEEVRNLLDSGKVSLFSLTSTNLMYYSPSGQAKQKFESVSLLHVAAEKGHVELIRYLLEKGIKVDATATIPGRGLRVTALHFASFNGHAAAVKILVEFGANLNLADTNEKVLRLLFYILKLSG